jgi:hypothetical protein
LQTTPEALVATKVVIAALIQKVQP